MALRLRIQNLNLIVPIKKYGGFSFYDNKYICENFISLCEKKKRGTLIFMFFFHKIKHLLFILEKRNLWSGKPPLTCY